MSGLEFVAQVVNTLLLADSARAVRWRIPMNALWCCALSLLAVLAVRTLRLRDMVLGIGGALLAAMLVPAAALSTANIWMDTVGPCLAVLLATGLEALRDDVRARRFMPTHVMRDRPATLTEPATVLFVDVRGSTAMAEKLDVETYQQTMSHIVGQMFDAVLKHGAEVDRTLGDGLMAVFRESDDVPDGEMSHSHHALRCLSAIKDLNRIGQQAGEHLSGLHDEGLRLTIGFESGVISGTVVRGAQYEEWKNYGTTINLAARLQSYCGQIGKRALCGPGAWSCIRQATPTDFAGTVTLKGIKDPMPAYSLDPDPDPERQPRPQEEIHDTSKVVPVIGNSGSLASSARP